jgi:hypothetical protein
MLAYRLNIKPQHIENIYYYRPTYHPKFFVDSVIASHGFANDELIDKWNNIGRLISFKTVDVKIKY